MRFTCDSRCWPKARLKNKIAERLAISAPTVATYIRRIYEKLHVRSRAAAIGKFSSLIKGLGASAPKES
jgi:hypothetical protein